ncbi:unnamed protein product [Wuchereria bancrofti]|uniref:Uncharacterized protein n=1 Tax=Wuchereria bancrofti TaxID=6293 RepID=A0A3P7EB82_WUCBA|nr:unnamed protein product [Wuchereria bancrofti]
MNAILVIKEEKTDHSYHQLRVSLLTDTKRRRILQMIAEYIIIITHHCEIEMTLQEKSEIDIILLLEAA